MEFTMEKEYQTINYCFPMLNTSCKKEFRSKSEHIFLYIFFSLLSVFTVFVNLLVILSICHFKQLQTPTNFFILSLAVADLFVGIFVIPVESIKFVESCWYFGPVFCFMFQLIVYTVISASLSILVFIAVDRYVAVCYPLLYSSVVTVGKSTFCICLSWSCSLIYNLILLYSNNHSKHEQETVCKGQCVLFISFTWGVIDVFFSFVCPCSVMITLYLKIFQVVRYQVQVINSVNTDNRSGIVVKTSKRSERKAAKTLGVVVAVYLLCWIPYYISLLTEDSISSSSIITSFFSWVLYTNSFVNPLIYAIFYPWFKTSVKLILQLKVFEKSSAFLNLHSENV